MQQKIKLMLEQLMVPVPQLRNEVQLINHFHQSMLFILEYIFSDQMIGTKQVDCDQKLILVQYIEKFKQFVNSKKDQSFQSVVNQLFKKRRDIINQEYEGFISSDDDSKTLDVIQNNYGDLFKDPDFRSKKVQDAIQQKDQLIQQLQLKIQARDSTILDLATGYLKDLQNMREQMFKKSDDLDFYEVQYFDISEIEDPKYRELVNQKISNLKSLYEKSTRDMLHFIQKQKAEIQTQKNIISGLELKTRNLENTEYLINKIFQLEPNPYIMWRMIQDTKGNGYFFEVFENQKSSFGINYREINKLLMVTKAYDREFEYFKKSIEDQMVVYLQRAIEVINTKNLDYEDQILQLNHQLAQQQQKYDNMVEDIIKHIDSFKQQCNQFFKQLVQKRDEELFQIRQQELNNLAIVKARYAFKLWSIINKIKNDDLSLREIIIYGQENAHNMVIKQQLNQLEQKYLDLVVKFEKQSVEIVEKKQLYDYQQIQCSELVARNKSLKIEIDELKVRFNNSQKLVNQVFRFIDPKIIPDQLNLDDANRETTKSFKEKIKEIKNQRNGYKLIYEIKDQMDKNSEALNLLKTLYQDQECQTYIFNVNKPLEEAVKQYEQNKEEFNLNEQIVQQQQIILNLCNQETQTDPFIDLDFSSTKYQQQFKGNKFYSANQDYDNSSNSPSSRAQLKRSTEFKQSIRPRTMKNTIHESKEDIDLIENLQRGDSPRKVDKDIQGIPGFPVLEIQSQDTQQYYDSDKQQDTKQDSKKYDKSFTKIARDTNYKTAYNAPLDQKSVFNRLFQDSKKKQDRIDRLKQKLERLEKEHWTQIVQIVQQNQEVVDIFRETLHSSKHFYQKILKKNIEIDLQCQQISKQYHKSNRAQFYFKKFKDFHINQDGVEQFPEFTNNKIDEAMRKNIKSVIENRNIKGKLNLTGLKREELQFFHNEKKQHSAVTTQRFYRQINSPRQTKPGFHRMIKGSPINLSYTSQEVNGKDLLITKNIQKGFIN